MKSKRLLHAKKTQVVLLSKIRGLGKRGDAVFVANGYFRNYLQPKELACKYDIEKQKELKTSAQHTNQYEDIHGLLNGKSLLFIENANTLGILFNSIKKKNIIDNIILSHKISDEDRLRTALSKCRIVIDPPIKKIGVYTILIELGDDIIEMRVSVASSIEEAREGL